MSEHAKDFLLALALIAIAGIALAILAATTGEPKISGAGVLTFATLPSIYAGALIALSALLALNAFRSCIRTGWRKAADAVVAPSSDADAKGPTQKTILSRTVATLLLLIVYALLLQYVHFMVLTTLFLAVLFVVLGQRSWLWVPLIAVLGGAGFYALFIWGLNLPI